MNDTESLLLSQMLFGREMTDWQFASTLQSEYAVEVVLITRAAEGCLMAAVTEIRPIPGYEIVVQDAVGAGDAFSAAFLSVWLRGDSAVKAAAFANVLGAYVATQNGSVPEYSGWIREQINRFLG